MKLQGDGNSWEKSEYFFCANNVTLKAINLERRSDETSGLREASLRLLFLSVSFL